MEKKNTWIFLAVAHTTAVLRCCPPVLVVSAPTKSFTRHSTQRSRAAPAEEWQDCNTKFEIPTCTPEETVCDVHKTEWSHRTLDEMHSALAATAADLTPSRSPKQRRP